MDTRQKIVFYLAILFYFTNIISGASLGNIHQLNETLDLEEEHRTVLQNIKKNYFADEFRNYEMADIEEFLNDIMNSVKDKKTIYTSKTFFGPDQFSDPAEESKDNFQHQNWDPFKAHRVSGSQPAYFDATDDLFQQNVYSKSNHEASYSKNGYEISSGYPQKVKDLGDDKFPFSETNATNEMNDIFESIDGHGNTGDEVDESSERTNLGAFAEDEEDESPESTRAGAFTEDEEDESPESTGAGAFTEDEEDESPESTGAGAFTEDEEDESPESTGAGAFTEEEDKSTESTGVGAFTEADESAESTGAGVLVDDEDDSAASTRAGALVDDDDSAESTGDGVLTKDDDESPELAGIGAFTEDEADESTESTGVGAFTDTDESEESTRVGTFTEDEADESPESRGVGAFTEDEVFESSESTGLSAFTENDKNSSEAPNFPKIDIDEFEGSGDTEDSFGEALKETILDSKSGRILDIFPRVNNTAECITPKGEKGRCRSLTQCPLSEPLNNFNLFLQYVCLSRGVLVGICCPDNPVVEIADPAENSTGSTVTELKQPIDGCGGSTNTRIVGGKVSLPHEWTWMVALMRRNRFFCGGVIINDWYILTAAHCVMGIKVKDLKVRLGEYNFNEKNEHQEDISVAEIKRHALFVTLTFQHDIALLKLKRRIEYSKFIGSICLPDAKSGNFSNVNATVVGWGTVAFGGASSPVLRQVTIPVWDNEECDKTYRLERITDAFMCAGSPETGEDACQGDSGGPLMTLNDEGRWEVIGIVSWGRRCGDPTFPGVYTRVSTYMNWIAENAT